MQRILLASTVLALSLVPVRALAQAVNEPPATFNERAAGVGNACAAPEQCAARGHR
jgi:hypothetical protein